MLASGFTPPAAGARVARRAYIWQITCHIIRICTNMVTPINQPKPEKEPIIAWHLVMCMYGFWLPNDPRGSWSHYVGSKSLYDLGGPATGGQHRRSVAATRHDHLLRVAVKAALKFPPVTLSGIQARAVGRGLAQAQRDGKYQIYACAIMPDHVHIVLRVVHRERWELPSATSRPRPPAASMKKEYRLAPRRRQARINLRCGARGNGAVI